MLELAAFEHFRGLFKAVNLKYIWRYFNCW